MDAFGDPPHHIIKRHQARGSLAMRHWEDHNGYVEGKGGHGQGGCEYASGLQRDGSRLEPFECTRAEIEFVSGLLVGGAAQARRVVVGLEAKTRENNRTRSTTAPLSARLLAGGFEGVQPPSRPRRRKP